MVMVMAMVIVIVMFLLVAQHAEQGSFVSWHGDARPTSPDPGARHFTGEGGNLEETNNAQITPRPIETLRRLRITIHHSYHLYTYIHTFRMSMPTDSHT